MLERNETKLLLWALLAINIAFAGYFVTRWVSVKPAAQTIPSNLVTENSLIKAEILKLSGSPENKQFAIALLSSKVNICASSKLADFFRTTRAERPDYKFYLLFSKSLNTQDIATFKDNLGLDFEGISMNDELDDYWEEISQKYETPSIIILRVL